MEKHLVVSQLLRYNNKHVKSYILPLNACIILELALILMIQAIFFPKNAKLVILDPSVQTSAVIV